MVPHIGSCSEKPNLKRCEHIPCLGMVQFPDVDFLIRDLSHGRFSLDSLVGLAFLLISVFFISTTIAIGVRRVPLEF